jgi:hypothetical protein
MDRRAAVGQEPEHLVPDGVAGDRRPGLLDHPGIVTAQDDRELVLGHALPFVGSGTGGKSRSPSVYSPPPSLPSRG